MKAKGWGGRQRWRMNGRQRPALSGSDPGMRNRWGAALISVRGWGFSKMPVYSKLQRTFRTVILYIRLTV